MEANKVKDNVSTGDDGTATAGEQKEKLFTQEQVNEIVRKRLKDRKETDINAQELDTRAAELDTQSKELNARESRLNCKEYLLNNGYNSELLDIIDTSDVEEFKKKADKVSQMFGKMNQDVAPLASVDDFCGHDAAGFPDTTHVPKGYWATEPR